MSIDEFILNRIHNLCLEVAEFMTGYASTDEAAAIPMTVFQIECCLRSAYFVFKRSVLGV